MTCFWLEWWLSCSEKSIAMCHLFLLPNIRFKLELCFCLLQFREGLVCFRMLLSFILRTENLGHNKVLIFKGRFADYWRSFVYVRLAYVFFALRSIFRVMQKLWHLWHCKLFWKIRLISLCLLLWGVLRSSKDVSSFATQFGILRMRSFLW